MAKQTQTGQPAAGRTPGAPMQLDPSAQRCIDECLHCHSVCLSTASQHVWSRAAITSNPVTSG